MKVQDPIQEYNTCKRNIRMARNAIGFLAGIMLALILGATMGCSTQAAQGGITEQHSQDLNNEDDNLVEFCQSWAIQTVTEEVRSALSQGVKPKDITEQMVIDGIGRAYGYCIRVNGRHA